MISQLQQEELARLRHAELLAEAAWARQLAQIRRARANHLAALFHRLGEQGRKWFPLRRPVTVDGVTASRQQAC